MGGENTNTEEIKEQKTEVENSIKITILREVADGLTELVNKVNDGFVAGRVHRQDVASWIIAKFLKSFSESDVNQIRAIHYDDSSMLEAMYRRMKETGEIPEFLRDAMRKQYQVVVDAPKKSSVKKNLTKEYTKDVHSKNGEAA